MQEPGYESSASPVCNFVLYVDISALYLTRVGLQWSKCMRDYGTRVVTLFSTSHFYLLKSLHEEERW